MQRISLIAPMLDEAAHIEHFVADVAAQDVGAALELIVADGGSTDGSGGLLERAAAELGVACTVLDNPSRWVSQGLNLCLARAQGELIVRLDCHSRYPPDYVRRLADLAERTGAWNVGGVVVPEGHTPTERAVACAMDSPFGGIGWIRQSSSGEPVEVDTVTFGAFRPAAFERVGGYDESLVRNQDDELNLRLRLAGGRIVLDPSLQLSYTPRGSYAKVLRQYHAYGLWKVPVMRKHGQALGARSLAPVAFVVSAGALAAAAPFSRMARRALAAELGLYAALGVIAATHSVHGRGEPWSLLPRVLPAFPAFHAGYGAGMAQGLVRAAVRN